MLYLHSGDFSSLPFSSSLCSHIEYSNKAEVAVKLYSFTCLSVYFLREWSEYEYANMSD